MNWNHWAATAALAAVAMASASCSTETTGVPVPDAVATTVLVAAGNGQHGEVGAMLAEPIVARVKDQGGAPMAGVPVTFTVAGGGGTLGAALDTTDADGLASTTWSLGYDVTAGSQAVTARVSGLTEPVARFHATAILTAGTVTVVGGDGQSAKTLTRLRFMPAVQVRTPGAAGVGVAGVVVSWAVTAGGGTTSSTTSTTGFSGVAGTAWTLGDTAGPQELHAAVDGISDGPVAFVANAIRAPTTIAIISGDHQAGMVGQLLGEPLVIEVRDALGTPVAGAPVSWHAIDPCDGWCDDWYGGSLSHSSSVTDTSGRASATFILGVILGNQQWIAQVSADQGVYANFSADVLPQQ